MRKYLEFLLLLGLIIALFAFQTEKPIDIVTEDIDHFWAAYDSLACGKTTEDSVAIIDRIYFGQATEGLKAYHIAQPNTALQHLESLRKYPKFWRSVRPMTQRAKTSKSIIMSVFDKYQAFIPNFRPTNVCFAIGCMNSGGTTDKNWIFIGTEMMAADSTVDKSELTDWQKTVIGTGSGNLMPIVAHEAIHTQQISTIDPVKDTLLQGIIDEGVADFIPRILLNLTINKKPFEYGYKNECVLWQQLQLDLPKDNYDNWLYNGGNSGDKPADLGYFMGFRIAEAFYNKRSDKREAIDILLKSRDYEAILAQSGYEGGCKK